MKKNIFIILLFIVISLIGCGSNDDKYLGGWQKNNSSEYMTISKDGDLFIVEYTNGDKFTAKLVSGSLKFENNYLGEANLSDDGTKIYCMGAEWLKNNAPANRDAVVEDLKNLASIAQQYYHKPTALGGGENTFNGWNIPSNIVSTGNGEYSSNVSSESVTLIGIGNEIGKDGLNKVKVTMVVRGDRVISTTFNN